MMTRKGFTLIELIVTVLIVGVLTAVAVPQYLLTTEMNKADDSASLVNMIGTTNKMYALNHPDANNNPQYVYGTFSNVNGECNTAVTTCPSQPDGDACDLVWCGYMSNQDWVNKPYTYYACDPGTGNGGGPCYAATSSAAGAMAGSRRKSGSYSAWGYTVDSSGRLVGFGGAPAPAY